MKRRLYQHSNKRDGFLTIWLVDARYLVGVGLGEIEAQSIPEIILSNNEIELEI